ncbi:hypothetical protein BJ944DRAFT_274242 [Cunninghamella echinulata]|nr:hypothetical protein BJ944DRAFT_274242 [Cunninghamella echinulata]
MEDQPALKPLSKVLLLRYAYEYITHLKQNLNERDEYIRKLTNGSDPTNQEEEEEERDDNGENGDNGDDDNDINMEQSSNN